MTKSIKTEGIVLKNSDLGENGKLLVIFSKDSFFPHIFQVKKLKPLLLYIRK